MGGSPHCPARNGAEVPLLFSLVIKDFSYFLFTFALLSSLLKHCEFYKVSGRQSNEVLEHLLSFIGSFSDVVESVIL